MKKGRMTGARAMVKALEAKGVKVVFGYPGGANLPIYDELAHSPIRHVLVRHEQGAAHMADGYARLAGSAGVCLATSGPGATNLVTGLATAFMDSSPVIAVTGQVARSMIGNDAFQEVDITGITQPITKHNYLIQRAVEIPAAFSQAFDLAASGRRGPVLLDIPRDVQTEEFSLAQVRCPPLEGYRPTLEGHPGQIRRAAALLKSSRRPLLIAGGGVAASDSRRELLRLAERGEIPVVYTLMGKDAFPNSHPLCLGLLGYHGRVAANSAVLEADVILAVGTRFGDRSTGPRQTFAPQARIIHIDVDPAEIGKNVPAFLPIVGDARNILGQLLAALPELRHQEWVERLGQEAALHPLKERGTGLTVPAILRTLKERLPGAILVTDVGRHQIFAAHHFPVETGPAFITSGGLGTMGFGLPAAIGAKAARPERPVAVVSGDGSFMMTCQQLAVAVEEELPLLILIINDSGLGMIQQLQDFFFGRRYQACRFNRSVDFTALAGSMGARGLRIEKEGELDAALTEATAGAGTWVIDCRLEDPVNVYPMVVGESLRETVE